MRTGIIRHNHAPAIMKEAPSDQMVRVTSALERLRTSGSITVKSVPMTEVAIQNILSSMNDDALRLVARTNTEERRIRVQARLIMMQRVNSLPSVLRKVD